MTRLCQLPHTRAQLDEGIYVSGTRLMLLTVNGWPKYMLSFSIQRVYHKFTVAFTFIHNSSYMFMTVTSSEFLDPRTVGRMLPAAGSVTRQDRTWDIFAHGRRKAE